MTIKKPELLIPAGNLEKLNIAFRYGADACYVGGTVFGLRKYADNFSELELKLAVKTANELGKKVYLVLNGFAHNQDMENLESYLKIIEKIHPHALIISDMGVFQVAKKLTTIPIHVSTQASVTNGYTCDFWYQQGAKRVVLAREVSLAECKEIQKITPVELEVFGHGAQCASYSGKCVISNYASGRDSNRGGCVQSCRHEYQMKEKGADEISSSGYIMNAKDLMGIRELPKFMEVGIHSLKVEGRMKSNLYVANTATIYRQAIDRCYEALNAGESFDPNLFEVELKKVSNRFFFSGGLTDRPFAESIRYEDSACVNEVDFVGTIKENLGQDGLIVESKQPFKAQDALFVLAYTGEIQPLQIDTMSNMYAEKITASKPNILVKLNGAYNHHPYQVVLRAK